MTKQNVTLSSPSSGSMVQLGGTISHRSRAPVGAAVGAEVGVKLGIPVGWCVGDIEGASDGHSPHTPNSRACRTSSF